MPVTMAAVGTHLARSDDHGASFSFVGDFFADVAAVDPGGSGENGRLSAETASLTSITVGSTTTWYGTHLHYFLRPITGYNPSYATGWTVQVAAATSPEALPTAASVTLGVTATSAGFSPSPQRLDQLAGLAQASCAMLNNPTLFARDDKLYLAVECLAFSGASMVPGGTTIQLFRTTPNGAPSAWTWAYAGELAGADLIARLGQDTIQQPDLSVAEDGTPILIVSPARKDSSTQVGTVPTGCVAIELASLDPPQLAQDCTGNLKIRERIEGDGFGACTHTAHSASGVVAVSEGASGGNWMLRASGAKP